MSLWVSQAPPQKGTAPNFGVTFNLCVYPLTHTTKFDVVKDTRSGLVFKSQQRPHPNRAVSQRSPNFDGSFVFMRAPFVTQNNQI